MTKKVSLNHSQIHIKKKLIKVMEKIIL